MSTNEPVPALCRLRGCDIRGQAQHGNTAWLFRIPLTLAAVALLSCISEPKAPAVKPAWPYGFNTRAKAHMTGHLAAAEMAWDQLSNRDLPPAAHATAEANYEKALSLLLRDWSRRQLPKHWQTETQFADGSRQFAVALQPPPGDVREVSPLLLDRLLLATHVRTPFRVPIAAQQGLGVPVVGHLHHSNSHAVDHAVTPPNGAYLTLTAVLDFAPKQPGQPRRCRLHLYNPLRVAAAPVAGTQRPLAASYTAAKHLALNDGFLDSFSVPGLLNPEKALAASQLYCLDPYDPKRIPVVFVHGLLSDPHIWFRIINAIYADPELRAHYQPWCFLYPTGLAIPTTANLLRESLSDLRQTFDPDHNDPGMNRMVLVGHSMGGLLGRMQTIDSRDDFWRAYFTCKPEELNLSEARRAQLVGSLHFKKQPYISRLIFIAVPHRGADIAHNGIVHRLSSIIRLPMDSALLSKDIISGNPDTLAPQIRDWGAFSFVGLGTLSAKHPYLQALSSQPISVPHHSIVARTGTRRVERSSDGIVPYESAHLGTGTESVIRGWHNCAKKPDVVAEVLLRLRQHLQESR